MAFTETWGSPCDPHSTVTSWLTNDEGGVYALANMSYAAGGFAQFQAAVLAVLTESNQTTRQAEWTVILQALHSSAVFFPLTYVANQAVWSQRLAGVQFGTTQYDLPMGGVQCVPYEQQSSAPQSSSSSSSSSSVPGWAIALLVIGLVAMVAAACTTSWLIHMERRGKAVFAPLMQPSTHTPTSP